MISTKTTVYYFSGNAFQQFKFRRIMNTGDVHGRLAIVEGRMTVQMWWVLKIEM